MSWAILWGAVAAALVIGEMFTGEFTLLSIAIGFMGAAIMAELGLGLAPQAGAALLLALGSLFMLAPALRRVMAPQHTPDNVEAMVGAEAEVVEAILPPAQGKVKVDGVVWQAESDRELPVGARVMITEVQGARLRVLGRQELHPRPPAAAIPDPEAERLRPQAVDESQSR